jgi:hypothetical protein
MHVDEAALASRVFPGSAAVKPMGFVGLTL